MSAALDLAHDQRCMAQFIAKRLDWGMTNGKALADVSQELYELEVAVSLKEREGRPVLGWRHTVADGWAVVFKGVLFPREAKTVATVLREAAQR